MKPRVRNATSSDIPAVLAFWTTASAGKASTDTVEALARLLDHDRGALIVALDNKTDEVVGTIIAAWDGWRGHLHRLAVAPSSRRLGAASLLIGTAEKYLRLRGANLIEVLVLSHNAAAADAYTACGYEVQTGGSV